MRCIVVRGERRCPSRARRRVRMTLRREPLRQRPPPVRCAPEQTRTFAIKPSFELGCARDVETVQQVAAVQCKRGRKVIRVARFLEGHDITPDGIRGDPDLLVSPSHDDVVAERAAEEVQRAAQRTARMLGVELGPEHREQRISAMKTPRRRERKVREHSQPLRLPQDGTQLATIGRAKLQRTEGP